MKSPSLFNLEAEHSSFILILFLSLVMGVVSGPVRLGYLAHWDLNLTWEIFTGIRREA
jgi:hypothetical protein